MPVQRNLGPDASFPIFLALAKNAAPYRRVLYQCFAYGGCELSKKKDLVLRTCSRTNFGIVLQRNGMHTPRVMRFVEEKIDAIPVNDLPHRKNCLLPGLNSLLMKSPVKDNISNNPWGFPRWYGGQKKFYCVTFKGRIVRCFYRLQGFNQHVISGWPPSVILNWQIEKSVVVNVDALNIQVQKSCIGVRKLVGEQRENAREYHQQNIPSLLWCAWPEPSDQMPGRKEIFH